MQQPPIRVNILEKTAFGVPLRAVGILAVSGPVALAALLCLPSLSLTLRGAIAVLVVGLGLALAFGEIDGQKPEAWLLGVVDFKRRTRYLVKGAQPQPDAFRVTLAPDATAPSPEAETAPTPGPQARGLDPQPMKECPAPRFFTLAGSAVCASVLAGLTLYLLTGGAARLLAIVSKL
jgi:hypothetical protein